MQDPSLVSPSELKSVTLSLIEHALRSRWLVDPAMASLLRPEPPPLLRLRTLEEQASEIRELVNLIREEQPFTRSLLAEVNTLIQRALDATDSPGAWKALKEAQSLTRRWRQQHLSQPNASTHYETKVTPDRKWVEIHARSSIKLDKDVEDALDTEFANQRFVASVMQMCREYRDGGREIDALEDLLALERAYQLLDRGTRLPKNYQYIRTDEYRPVQTYLSFADPGDGHLATTVRENALLDGLIVHIEYIDRDNVASKDLVEAYRLPALRNAAKVRLHVGSKTPCTAFIGRPVFEANSFESGLLKAGHTIASVCSAMFAIGIADCKIAMDKMTARQAVLFMRVVAGNVVRDSVRQRLSAAFNINTPISNDLSQRGLPVDVPERERAEFAIRLVRLGAFDKIAWDGASDGPSKAILGEQLTRAELLALVHAAHQSGLETYISAGMTPEHMRDAVYTGVGGVGIGTKLHHQWGMVIGEIDRSLVGRALKVQKEASQEVLGKASKLLARLDWRYAEGSLTPITDRLRHELFQALSSALNHLDEKAGTSSLSIVKAKSAEIEEAEANVLKITDQALKFFPEKRIRPEGVRKRSATSSTPDPVIAWAERVVSAVGKDQHELANSDLSGAQIERIAGFLAAHDVERLKDFYPLNFGENLI